MRMLQMPGSNRVNPFIKNSVDVSLETINAWRGLPIEQQPEWPDSVLLSEVSCTLSQLPPLVFAGEVDKLRLHLQEAAEGRAFILQGGDCAESFRDITADNISRKLKTILQMAAILTYAAGVPIIKMARMAGQYAKPRSEQFELVDGRSLPVYRGDMVNGHELHDRVPDPKRMLKAYELSAATLNLIRAFTRGGFADLRALHVWNRGFAESCENEKYEELARKIDKAIAFMNACDVDCSNLTQTEVFVCHEGLLLDYEHALTRCDSRTGFFYDTSAHFLWIGERTRQIDGAHIDFFSKIENPIGVKLSSKVTARQVLELANRLDPGRTPGRLTFITRMGAGNIRQCLPGIIEAVRDGGFNPAWVCDPMHGNTITSSSGYKTRRFMDILDEVRGFFDVHRSVGTHPGGLHVELTGDDVTECTGGFDSISDDDLKDRYESLCDPRLNHRQSLELAFFLADCMK